MTAAERAWKEWEDAPRLDMQAYRAFKAGFAAAIKAAREAVREQEADYTRSAAGAEGGRVLRNLICAEVCASCADAVGRLG